MGNRVAGRVAVAVMLGLLSITGGGCATVATVIGEGIAGNLDTKETPTSATRPKGDTGTPSHSAPTPRR